MNPGYEVPIFSFNAGSSFLRTGVSVRAQKMRRDVRLLADHPAIVPGRNVEDVSRLHRDDSAVSRVADRDSIVRPRRPKGRSRKPHWQTTVSS